VGTALISALGHVWTAHSFKLQTPSSLPGLTSLSLSLHATTYSTLDAAEVAPSTASEAEISQRDRHVRFARESRH